jgi:phage tail-like protein
MAAVSSNSSANLYRNFKFRLLWNGKSVAGVSKCSALTRSTPVTAHRAGGDPTTPRRMPGQSAYDAITLERGVTHDIAFEQWANKVWDYHDVSVDDQQGGASAQDVSLKDFRRDFILEVYYEASQKVAAYTIRRCWPSEFIAVPEMDANGAAVAIQMLKLENEGWERDTSVADSDEPSLTPPTG